MSPTHSREARQQASDNALTAYWGALCAHRPMHSWPEKMRLMLAHFAPSDLALARSIAGEDRDQLQRGMDERQEQR